MVENIRRIGSMPGEGRSLTDIRYASFAPDDGSAINKVVSAELRIGEEEFSHYAAGIDTGLHALILSTMANGASFTRGDVATSLQAAARDTFSGRDVAHSVRNTLRSMERFGLVVSDVEPTSPEDAYRISRIGSVRGLAYAGGPFLTIHGLGIRADRLWGDKHPRLEKEQQVIETEDGTILYKPRTAQVRYRILQAVLREASRVRRPENVNLRQGDIARRIQIYQETVSFSLLGMADAGVLTYERDPNKTKVTLTKPQHEMLLAINGAILNFRLGDPRDMQRYREKALAMLRNPALVAQLLDQSLPPKAAAKAGAVAMAV